MSHYQSLSIVLISIVERLLSVDYSIIKEQASNSLYFYIISNTFLSFSYTFITNPKESDFNHFNFSYSDYLHVFITSMLTFD